MNKFKLLAVFIIAMYHQLLFADITVTPAAGGINLAQNSPNVSGGWAVLGDIIIIEDETDDIAGGQTDVTLILGAPGNWEFQAGAGTLFVLGDLDDPGINPPSLNITPSEIILTFSTRSDGNSGTNEIDIIIFEGIRVRPLDPALAPSPGKILRTGGTASIAGGAVSDSLNYGDLSLDINNPLPVELSYFTSVIKNNSVYLRWETVSETNNYGFDVERSINGMEWEKLSFIPGNGNSNSPKSYSFTDNNLNFPGKYFYRLKQIDSDGRFEYSYVIEVDIEIVPGFELSQNYPNPFNPETKIKFVFMQNTKAELKLYDVAGGEMSLLFNGDTEAGRIYEITFNASGLSSGVYYYRLTGGNKTDIKKMIILK